MPSTCNLEEKEDDLKDEGLLNLTDGINMSSEARTVKMEEINADDTPPVIPVRAQFC